MSGIVLSSSVRQNLLSLQSTASLLATTQNDLSTGNKVNSALDNPTSFFTAAALNNRAGDIGNLLDSIGNGVQVLQAANTGITSLQSLVASAQSIANQVLQTPIGFSAKSSVTATAVPGATANNLLGTTAADATFTGAKELDNQTIFGTGVGTAVAASQLSAFTNAAAPLGTQLFTAPGPATNATGATLLSALTTTAGAPQAIAVGDTLTINGTKITFAAGSGALAGTGANRTLGVDTSLDTLVSAIDTLQGNTGTGSVPSTDTGGQIQLNTGVAADLTVQASSPTVLTALGLSTAVATTVNRDGNQPVTTPAPVITGTTPLAGTAVAGGAPVLGTALTATDQLTVNGKTISFHAGIGNTGTITGNDFSIGLGSGTINDVLTAIDQATGGNATVDATGKISVATNTSTAINFTGSVAGTLSTLGLTTVAAAGIPVPTIAAITTTTALSGPASSNSNALTSGFADGDTLTVNGKILTFSSTNPTSTPSANGGTISTSGTVQDVLNAIDAITGSSGANAASVTNGQITLHTGTASALSITSSNTGALASLGFGTGVTQADSTLTNKTLTIGATGNGVPTSITFGTGVGQVSTLNQLNNALAANNLQATIDSNGAITVTTSNNAASSTIAKIGGTAAPFSGLTALGPVADPNSQATRAGLITQYNNTLKQIDTTAQDASFNGINLLSGDTLNLTFDETGKSNLAIQGIALNTAGLALSPLAAGTDFLDSNSANAVLASLSTASTTLRAEASNLGSNLSIVEIRQDFSKSLINVLQTGASNLTLADTNEEAANSQALSTRQSIAVSALALANQSQQSVLQLLR
jgi:flagellin